MPEYKRFIAYFYEYINGKRQRNAGFLKAELRGGAWRLQLQLRASRWPDGGMEIYGYVDEETQCPTVLLGRAYGQKENLTKRMELGTGPLNPAGLRFDTLSGIWIPCDERRCYISHWLEGEITPERLALPESREFNTLQQTVTEAETEAPQSGSSAAELPGKEMAEEGEPVQESETKSEAAAREKPEGEPEMTASEESERKPDLAVREEPEEESEVTASEEPKGEAVLITSEEAEGEPEVIVSEEPKGEPELTASETPAANPDESQESQQRQMRDLWQTDWEMLQRSHRAVGPLEEEGFAAIRICPRDILWLKQRGWPVGRNSFLMQGFGQFRHLLLIRMEEGNYLLGVPGLENPQNQSQAETFGFPEFLRGQNWTGMPENFGYWCRRLEQNG